MNRGVRAALESVRSRPPPEEHPERTGIHLVGGGRAGRLARGSRLGNP